MTEKYEMNDMELDMVAGGLDGQDVKDGLMKFGLEVWKWLYYNL